MHNSDQIDVLIALHRIGPYHHARFCKAAESLNLAVVETRPCSAEYPWVEITAEAYPRHALTGQSAAEEDPPNHAIERQLHHLIDALKPKVIVSVGWADRAYQRLLIVATNRRIPVVIVSDSRWRDEARSRIKERIKRLLLRGYSAALVAGQESRSYLAALGFPPDSIFQPWDVVDERVFMADPSHTSGPSTAHPHFLCVSRFVAKKNHLGLLAAFASYRQQGGKWGLRLIGSGTLQAELEAAVANCALQGCVSILPFQQIDQLALSYQKASAFVLASSTDQWGLVVNEAMAAGLPVLVSGACGCAVDLVSHASTGWVFPPGDAAALTKLLHTAERQSEQERRLMVQAARARLQAFSLEAFAQGLQAAVAAAAENPRQDRLSCILARILSRR
ncbi:glycosyltransferase family 4 protein [Synechococcus sp. ATX 2A4]|nr:glycosyltransferase family 4 protein [Synechococcus sp. ATX 2A4]